MERPAETRIARDPFQTAAEVQRTGSSTEPVILELAENGPAAKRLQEGDTLTAVDGLLITIAW